MNIRYLGWALLLGLFTACGGDDDNGGSAGVGGTAGTAGAGGSGGSGVAGNGGEPSSTGGTPNTGGSGPGCDTAPCEGVSLGGQTAPTCCRTATACGVSLGGNCVDPATIPTENEVIVDDATCPDTSFSGMGLDIDLPGCCDISGVCGVSTAAFAAMAGFPVMCLTNTEAQEQFGQSLPGDAGAETPCNYPSDGGVTPDGGGGTGGGTSDAGPSGDASTADGG